MKWFADDQFLADVKREYKRARKLFPPFKSGHEGYAVILEELEELWGLVKSTHNPENTSKEMGVECVQIAAMAMAFYLDLLNNSQFKENGEPQSMEETTK